MTHRGGASVRRQRIAFWTTVVFAGAALSIFILSFLPFFSYLSGDGRPRSSYDLVSLERMDRFDRQQLVESWAREWEGLDEAQRADRADQFLDSLVDYMEEKLDLDRTQKVDTKSLVKSAVLVANQAGLGDEDFKYPDEARRKLGEQVRAQVEAILTPEQRKKLADLVDEQRRQRSQERGARVGRDKGGPP